MANTRSRLVGAGDQEPGTARIPSRHERALGRSRGAVRRARRVRRLLVHVLEARPAGVRSRQGDREPARSPSPRGARAGTRDPRLRGGPAGRLVRAGTPGDVLGPRSLTDPRPGRQEARVVRAVSLRGQGPPASGTQRHPLEGCLPPGPGRRGHADRRVPGRAEARPDPRRIRLDRLGLRVSQGRIQGGAPPLAHAPDHAARSSGLISRPGRGAREEGAPRRGSRGPGWAPPERDRDGRPRRSVPRAPKAGRLRCPAASTPWRSGRDRR